MRLEVDVSEVEGLADLLAEAPKQALAAVHKVTVAEGTAVTTRAKAAAPQDRPWLATQGIRQKTRSNRSGTSTNTFTVPDPEGRAVGFYVEFGTSDTPPQPFMTPAVGPAQHSYPDAVLASVDPFANAGPTPSEGESDE